MDIKQHLLLKDYKPVSMLKTEDHTPVKPRFPVIDAHNHLFGDPDPAEIVRVMDETGVLCFLNVTGNVSMPFEENCYTIQRRDFTSFTKNYCDPFPKRFAAFTMSDFAQWGDPVLLKNDDFADLAIIHLEEDIKNGALGLKITKELGLFFKDAQGEMVPVDDKRLYPVWQKAGELGIPVLIHVSDPKAFFLPIDQYNEHYLNLGEFPGWSFYGSHFSKEELLEQRNRMIADHPKTTFICPHVANLAEDLNSVAKLMDSNPNIFIDFSARIDELGRQPYSSREFMIKYQDRIFFAVDMPVTPEIYRCYFRFLETGDEGFDYPDYIGRWGYSRWKLCGLNLPDNVLEKIYYKNIVKLIPELGKSVT